MPTAPLSEFKPLYHDHVRHDVIDVVPEVGGRLLDLGGGIGATAAHIKALGKVDEAGTADMVDPQKAAGTLDFVYQGNLEDEAFLEKVAREKGPFRIILALDILEHLVDPWQTVRHLSAMLEPGGRLIASIPNVRHWRASARLMLGGTWDYAEDGILDRTHLRFFVRRTAVALIEQGGLRIESVGSTAASKRASLLRKLTFGLFASLTDMQYVIVARKD